MITYVQKDIFTTASEAIVNTVNCVGVMGRGIALQFKKRYPENYRMYEIACRQRQVVPGRMFVYETNNLMGPRYIINFPTKRHWREASRLEDIENGLHDLVQVIASRKIRSIAIPPLGCGLGGLDWAVVRSKIESALGGLGDVRVEVYEPGGAPEAATMVNSRPVPRMTPGRAALIVLIQKYLDGLLDPFITLLEVHKLMYFLQERGEVLRLQYKKHLYGPYAENLRHVLNELEGHYISGYGDGGDAPQKELNLMPGAYDAGERFLMEYPDTMKRMSEVCALVDGFETAFGLELLATVHWLVKKERCGTLVRVIQATYQWNEHKRQFSERQLKLAAQHLAVLGWIERIEGLD